MSRPNSSSNNQFREDYFRKFASKIAQISGSSKAFFVATLLIIVWLLTGPIFKWSTTWQLFINSFTTIITFLMVFVVQNSQNRDTRAMHVKLDELLRAVKGASPSMISTEEVSDEQLELLRKHYRSLHEKYLLAEESRKKRKTKKSKSE